MKADQEQMYGTGHKAAAVLSEVVRVCFDISRLQSVVLISRGSIDTGEAGTQHASEIICEVDLALSWWLV